MSPRKRDKNESIRKRWKQVCSLRGTVNEAKVAPVVIVSEMKTKSGAYLFSCSTYVDHGKNKDLASVMHLRGDLIDQYIELLGQANEKIEERRKDKEKEVEEEKLKRKNRVRRNML
jgi:hypothetical protein